MKTPKTKLQTPKKFQAPDPNPARDVAALELVIWNFSGVWSLVLGVWIPTGREAPSPRGATGQIGRRGYVEILCHSGSPRRPRLRKRLAAVAWARARRCLRRS